LVNKKNEAEEMITKHRQNQEDIQLLNKNKEANK